MVRKFGREDANESYGKTIGRENSKFKSKKMKVFRYLLHLAAQLLKSGNKHFVFIIRMRPAD
jgi:hypothetical protein